MQKSVADKAASSSAAATGHDAMAEAAAPPATLARRLAPVAALAALVGGVLLGWNWWTVGRFLVSTDDAYVAVRAATLAPKVGGYLTEFVAADHGTVKAGEVIARIDAGDYRLAVRQARDAVSTQQAVIATIVQQTATQRAAVQQAQAQVDAAKAAALKASLDLKRQTDLALRKINSAQALDNAQAAHEQAKAAVVAAEAGLAAAVGAVAVFEAQRLEAESQLRQTETAFAKAERDLAFTDIVAPFDGVLGNRAVQVGDYLQPAQRLASLVPADALYIDANFKETQLFRLRPGQRVRVRVDADASQEFEGVVESFAPASGSVFSLLPPDNATGNFTKIVQRVPVRIALPPEARRSTLLRPGMSVVVSVNTKPGTERAPPALSPSIVPSAPVAAAAPQAAQRP